MFSISVSQKKTKNNIEYEVKLYLFTCIRVRKKMSFSGLTSQKRSDPDQIQVQNEEFKWLFSCASLFFAK